MGLTTLKYKESRAKQTARYRDVRIAQTAADDILKNVTMLDNISSEEELNQVMPQLLASLGAYSMSDRSYVFSWTSEKQDTLHMTHEWCAEGVAASIDKMQNLRMSDMPNWSPRLYAGEAIVYMDWQAQKEYTPEEYALFDGQDIHALIVIPIFANKRLNGYIGFDNPEQKKKALSVRLLTAIGGHIGGLKENLHMMTQLEEKQRSLQNSLYELHQEKAILDALSIDYTSVYYCDLDADTVSALKQGDYTNSVATEQTLTDGLNSFSFRIQYYYDTFVIHELAPDFLEKLSAEYLKEHLSHNERFAYRFRARPNQAGQQYFEVQIVRLQSDEGFKVVMGYRFVDDLVAEQEKQNTRLEKALAEANLNSEIIDSISKIYWLIYRMDLVAGTYEEISAGQEVHRLTGKRGPVADVFRNVRETVVSEELQKAAYSNEVLHGANVLLVEDNDLNMDIAEFLLENAGMKVAKAWNGKEAVEMFEASEEGYYDFILMDVMMPVMDGLAATRKIRELPRDDAASVPVFAMTANAFIEDKEASREAGMNEHLSKPLDEEKMMDMLKKYAVR